MSKTQPRVCPPRLLLMSKHPVGEEVDKNDPSLPKEIQHLVREEIERLRKQNVKNSTQSLSSETLTDVETPGW